MIETRLLLYFLTIAQEETISKAAETLHITQSTLSKQMKDLEDQLGKVLFIRGKRKIALTEEGRYLQQRGREILDLLSATEGALKEETELLNGNIYFGCGETQHMEAVSQCFKDLQQLYPQIHLHLYTGDHTVVMDRMDKGLIDIGLVVEPTFREGYDYFYIGRTDLSVLLMRKDDPLATKPHLYKDDLKDLPLILSRQGFVNPADYELFGTSRSNLNIVATYNLINNMMFLVDQGLGYGVTLSGLLPPHHPTLTSRPIEPPLENKWYLVTHSHRLFSPTVTRFLDELKKYFAAEKQA
ncbi:MAG: LysR family transcriptional regulator [Veillonella sp.]|uniref:LysR family transcriptional regulator n=1 Tax=Veillonella sp. TaxID=1926307 RepID=UPI0025D542A3|nr:LysR family transcriptional regulator [Veillonella sp.]MBS4913979.1 LysR family transcriptional regulator [Veillonella sp.]